MSKTFTFPVWLIGTPEEQKAEADRQALALAAHGRGRLTEAERLIGRGALLEKTARGNLQAAGDDQDAITLAASQLADAYAMQGRYADAADVHPDLSRTQHFEKIAAAIEMDDEEKCGCPDSKAEMNGVDLSVTPRFDRGVVFSPAHGDTVSLVECSKCGHLNARPLRSRLLKHNAARNQNERTDKPVTNDAQVLNAGS